MGMDLWLDHIHPPPLHPHPPPPTTTRQTLGYEQGPCLIVPPIHSQSPLPPLSPPLSISPKHIIFAHFDKSTSFRLLRPYWPLVYTTAPSGLYARGGGPFFKRIIMVGRWQKSDTSPDLLWSQRKEGQLSIQQPARYLSIIHTKGCVNWDGQILVIARLLSASLPTNENEAPATGSPIDIEGLWIHHWRPVEVVVKKVEWVTITIRLSDWGKRP